MSVFRWPRGGAFLVALLLASTATIPAIARQNTKKGVQRPAMSYGIDGPAAPARYFTINQVLARRDGERAPGAQIAGAPTTGAPNVQLASTTTTMTDEPPAGRPSLLPNELFGLSTFRAPEGLLWVKWRDLERRMQVEAWETALCHTDRGACSSQGLFFLRLVEGAKARSGRARLDMVNRAVNSAIRYTSDYAQHGVADYWTAPLASLASGRGDCEDYAIAKYAILRAAGVAAEDLRLLLVRDRAVRQDHAVLAVRDNGQWLVLDNRHATLHEPGMLPQFAPLFAIDHGGVSLFVAPYAAHRPAPAVRPTTVTAPGAQSKAGPPGDDAGAAARASALPARSML
jgi:predicted transglutaminase-like cysteine proteinase